MQTTVRWCPPTICVSSNFPPLSEYIFNYRFYQDGNIELEIRLTGILQVYAEDPATPGSSLFATTVAPGVSAHYHQHIFSVRLDPMIDGLANTVVETDVIPLPDAPTGSPQNFAGNAFTTRATPIIKQREGGRDFDLSTDRRWSITSANRKHPVSGKPTSYSIMSKGTMTPVFARPDSWIVQRAGFTKKALWVVKDKEGPKGSRVWPSGKYVPGTRVAPDESIVGWVEKGEDESLEGEDVLVYLTAGMFRLRAYFGIQC